MRIVMVAAVEDTGGIGWLGSLPWPNISADMKYFKELTTNGIVGNEGEYNTAVVMGRKTWDSIPSKFRPLPDRLNMVMTRGKNLVGNSGEYVHCRTVKSVALNCMKREIDDLFVIGGEEIYKLFMKYASVDYIYLTQIKGIFKCDKWFPEFNGKKVIESKLQTEDNMKFKFSVYEVRS